MYLDATAQRFKRVPPYKRQPSIKSPFRSSSLRSCANAFVSEDAVPWKKIEDRS